MLPETMNQLSGNSKNYNYRLINLDFIVVIITFLILTICGAAEMYLLKKPLSIFIALTFLFFFLMVVFFIVLKNKHGKVPLTSVFSLFSYLFFDDKGILFNNSVFIPWSMLADIKSLSTKSNKPNSIEINLKILEIHYIDLDVDKMRNLSIFAWSKNYDQITSLLFQMKNRYSSKNILCPSCRKELSTDAEKGKMIYFCNECNKKYFQKIRTK